VKSIDREWGSYPKLRRAGAFQRALDCWSLFLDSIGGNLHAGFEIPCLKNVLNGNLMDCMNRRQFITTATMATSAFAVQGLAAQAPHIASNVYPWMTFARRNDRNWTEQGPEGIGAVASTGVHGFEPIGDSPDQIRKLAASLEDNGLEMRSLYVNSKLHEAKEAEASIDLVLAIASEASKAGAKIVVTNPSPIRWGGPENKNDLQLHTQATALDHLGARLRERGMILAYHNHDAELREGAREFHHMLTATDPANVKLCLDAHWVYRGCGNSQIALFDAVEHYHERIVELHLRQSERGIWTEVFKMDGDIDYRRLFDQLESWSISPHLVLEQAIENETPDSMTAVEAHVRSREILLAAL